MAQELWLFYTKHRQSGVEADLEVIDGAIAYLEGLRERIAPAPEELAYAELRFAGT